jgi:hypothetical protein
MSKPVHDCAHVTTSPDPPPVLTTKSCAPTCFVTAPNRLLSSSLCTHVSSDFLKQDQLLPYCEMLNDRTMALNSSGFTLISGLAYFENPHMSPGLSADSYFFDIMMCTCALEDENPYVKCSLCINSTTDCTPMACNINMINTKVNTERSFQCLMFHFTFINVNFSRLLPSARTCTPQARYMESNYLRS